MKSKRIDQHIEDLNKVFKILRKNTIKCNPKKYVFGVSVEKFLKFMVSQRGIKANPEKIQAILDAKSGESCSVSKSLSTTLIKSLHKIKISIN